VPTKSTAESRASSGSSSGGSGSGSSGGPEGYTSTAFLVSLQLIDIIAKQLEESKPENVPIELYLGSLSNEYISQSLDKCKSALVKEIHDGVS
jgi:hypothetical protein